MDFLDYDSDSHCESDEDVILEDSEEDYGSDSAEDIDSNKPVYSDLEFIAAYAVDTPTFVTPVPISKSTITNQVVEASSSDESDSESDDKCDVVEDVSSSDDSDSESEPDMTADQRKTKFRSLLTEEEEESVAVGPPRTKNEVFETILYPNEEAKIATEEVLLKVGEVMYRIDHECVVVVQASYTNSPLNEGSTLCHANGVVLGRIHEIFGPITTPYYIVRWDGSSRNSNNNNQQTNAGDKKKKGNNNKNKEGKKPPVTKEHEDNVKEEVDELSLDHTVEPIESVDVDVNTVEDNNDSGTSNTAVTEEPAAPKKIVVNSIQQVSELFVPGTIVYAAKSKSSFVTPGILMQQFGKGSDASNAHDEEVPEEELDYSDDEQELAARQARNRAKKGLKGGVNTTSSTHATGGGPSATYKTHNNKRNASGNTVTSYGSSGAYGSQSYTQPLPPQPSQPYMMQQQQQVPQPYPMYAPSNGMMAPYYPSQPPQQYQQQQQVPMMWSTSGYVPAPQMGMMYAPPQPSGQPPVPPYPYPGQASVAPLQYTHQPIQQQLYNNNNSYAHPGNPPKPPGAL